MSASASFPEQFDPRVVLDDPSFKVLPNDGVLPRRDPSINLALFYNQHKVGSSTCSLISEPG